MERTVHGTDDGNKVFEMLHQVDSISNCTQLLSLRRWQWSGYWVRWFLSIGVGQLWFGSINLVVLLPVLIGDGQY